VKSKINLKEGRKEKMIKIKRNNEWKTDVLENQQLQSLAL
jgi:hypothetical protein